MAETREPLALWDWCGENDRQLDWLIYWRCLLTRPVELGVGQKCEFDISFLPKECFHGIEKMTTLLRDINDRGAVFSLQLRRITPIPNVTEVADIVLLPGQLAMFESLPSLRVIPDLKIFCLLQINRTWDIAKIGFSGD